MKNIHPFVGKNVTIKLIDGRKISGMLEWRNQETDNGHSQYTPLQPSLPIYTIAGKRRFSPKIVETVHER